MFALLLLPVASIIIVVYTVLREREKDAALAADFNARLDKIMKDV